MTEPLTLDVRCSGRRLEAEAVLDLAAEPQTVWETITDYPALPRFMPGIRACRVLQREAIAEGAERLAVEQRGEFRFLLFAQAMTVLLDVEHRWPCVTAARAVRFDLGLFSRRAVEAFEGRYELAAAGDAPGTPRVQLRYRALIGLHLPPPPAIGSHAVRQNLGVQLRAVAAEVARRQRGRATPS